jgi:hypothetical protein
LIEHRLCLGGAQKLSRFLSEERVKDSLDLKRFLAGQASRRAGVSVDRIEVRAPSRPQGLPAP